MRFLHFDDEELRAIDDLIWQYIDECSGYSNEVRASVYGYCFGVGHKPDIQELREFLFNTGEE